jgi:putative transcriptional regulator
MLETLKKLRKDRGLRQADIAAILGISKQLYSLIERGETKLPYDRAVRIAKIFGTTPDEIFLRPMSSDTGQKKCG